MGKSDKAVSLVIAWGHPFRHSERVVHLKPKQIGTLELLENKFALCYSVRELDQ
jgi:hypothetical protein